MGSLYAFLGGEGKQVFEELSQAAAVALKAYSEENVLPVVRLTAGRQRSLLE